MTTTPLRERLQGSSTKPGWGWHEPTATKAHWYIGIGSALVTGLSIGAFTVLLSAAWFSTSWPIFGLILGLSTAGLWCLALAIVRHYPLLALLTVTLAGALQLIYPGPTPVLCLVPILAYLMARWTPTKRSRLVVWIGGAGSFLGPFRWLFTGYFYGIAGDGIGELLFALFLMGICFTSAVIPYIIGRRVRDSAEHKALEHQRDLEQLEMRVATEQQRVLTAEAQARNAIARELHDIIAHSLSIIIVQAEGAKALAEKKPEAAVVALDTIADTGRSALSEARRMVGVLRRDPNAPGVEYTPAPGLADIEELVSRSGDTFSYTQTGQIPEVSSTTALAAYRIIQEAITNVHKHAGPDAHGSVSVDYTDDSILLEIVDDGRGVAAPTDGKGNGLRGMYERASAAGGMVVAQPREGGGFFVRAMLPIDSSRSLR